MPSSGINDHGALKPLDQQDSRSPRPRRGHPLSGKPFAEVFLSGCSGTIFNKYDVDDGSVAMDARQRVILSARRGTQPMGREKNGQQITGRRIVCAEPSPDVATTLASSAGANLTLAGMQLPGTIDAATRYQMAEQAAYIGARNATIQLLRDGLYRSCEAYMNGALGDFGYGLILVNYGKLMVATLAAEGLTRPPFVPPVVFGSTVGSSDSTRNLQATPPAAAGGATGDGGAGAPAAGAPAPATPAAGGSTVDNTDKSGAGQPIAELGNTTNASAGTINGNVENIFKDVVYNLANPLADGNGTTKATEIAVACMLAMDQSGIRPPAAALGANLATMCGDVLGATPEMIHEIVSRQLQIFDARIETQQAEARLTAAQAAQAERSVQAAGSGRQMASR